MCHPGDMANSSFKNGTQMNTDNTDQKDFLCLRGAAGGMGSSSENKKRYADERGLININPDSQRVGALLAAPGFHPFGVRSAFAALPAQRPRFLTAALRAALADYGRSERPPVQHIDVE